METQRLKKLEGYFAVNWDKSIFKLFYQVPITINYEHKTNLPIVNYYKRIYSTAEYLAMIGCFTSEKNQNLTHL